MEVIPRLFEGKVQTLFLIACAAFATLAAALFYTQVWQGQRYAQLAAKNRVRRVMVEAPRGRILDRHGAVLADNRPRFDLTIVREELPKEKTDHVEFLAGFLGLEQKAVWKALQTTATVPYLPSLLLRDIGIELLTRVEERAEALPALQVQVQPARFYTQGAACAHWVGIVGKIPEKDLEYWKEKGVGAQETVGKSGIERVFDDRLRGAVGGMQVQINNRGYLDKVLGARDPIAGADVRLTMDLELQRALDAALEGLKGCGIALDPSTGKILALVSKPAYDPNRLATGTDRAEISKILQDPDRPLFFRPSMGLYSPGSLFKLAVAAAYLRENPEGTSRRIFCDGKFKLGDAVFRCWKEGGHGSLDLLQAIQYSCNVYFYEIGLETGPEKIAQTAAAFGFGRPTGFLLGEKSGLVPTPEWKKRVREQAWYGGDTANFSIGQGAVLCTPVQMAGFIGAIANGGKWRKPVLTFDEKREERDLSLFAPQIRELAEGMRRVVQEPDGTGRRAYLRELPAAGKTGTVEVAAGGGEKIKHTWFGCFAPSENPEIVVVVLVEEGESGGQTAAPVVKKVLEAWVALKKKRGAA